MSACDKLNGTNFITLVPFSKEDLSRVREAKDPYKKVDAEIDRVNRGKLKAMPVSLTRSGGSLYVQGTFPPKPGERGVEPRYV